MFGMRVVKNRQVKVVPAVVVLRLWLREKIKANPVLVTVLPVLKKMVVKANIVEKKLKRD